MTTRQGDYEENNNLKRINDELLKLRAAAKAEVMEEHGNVLVEIKKHLLNNEYESARQLAVGLRETLLFQDIVELFQRKPVTSNCKVCGRTTDPLTFDRESLTWIQPHICDSCEEKEREAGKERLSRYFAMFLEKSMDKILEAIGVTGRLLSGSYTGLPPDIVQICRRAAMGRHGLFIHGGVGTGKSCLTIACTKDMLRTARFSPELQKKLMRDISAFGALYRFLNIPDLLKDIKATYGNRDYQGEQRIIEEYSKLSVLILDDVGMEKPSEWVREKMYRIVDFRNNRELKTLFTSNISPEELRKHLGERIASRIFQQCEIIHLIGPDRRRE